MLAPQKIGTPASLLPAPDEKRPLSVPSSPLQIVSDTLFVFFGTGVFFVGGAAPVRFSLFKMQRNMVLTSKKVEGDKFQEDLPPPQFVTEFPTTMLLISKLFKR